MKELKKEKLEIIILVLFVMLGLGYAYVAFLFLPEWTVIQRATSQLNAQMRNYQELLAYQKNQSALQQDIKTLETKVQQLKAQVPNRLDKPQLMVDLYTLAKQHSVSPQSITFEPIQTKGSYQTIGMNVNYIGKTADVLALIHDMQYGGGQRLTLQSLNLTVSQGNMRAFVKLTAYASVGASDSTQKPAYMNSPIGVDTPAKMFQP
ncbi:type 4a pilus biogenesis protein PilO [Desulfosporosinus metallidurans]|uniref:Type IV pilus biogenesis protein PilO n=1 Tax=Desulfosporosinus metallidurans TaxID=1888891 RepID=A0A1Q8QYB6_9FIRM|nr:type 4a pilus biogenesis protein PilO [Desulfosporosinus metallidurans]OLN32230.1 Type IV pilus biogenesis protein PilO [Desulfosporosinus metallidurans]